MKRKACILIGCVCCVFALVQYTRNPEQISVLDDSIIAEYTTVTEANFEEQELELDNLLNKYADETTKSKRVTTVTTTVTTPVSSSVKDITAISETVSETKPSVTTTRVTTAKTTVSTKAETTTKATTTTKVETTKTTTTTKKETTTKATTTSEIDNDFWFVSDEDIEEIYLDDWGIDEEAAAYDMEVLRDCFVGCEKVTGVYYGTHSSINYIRSKTELLNIFGTLDVYDRLKDLTSVYSLDDYDIVYQYCNSPGFIGDYLVKDSNEDEGIFFVNILAEGNVDYLEFGDIILCYTFIPKEYSTCDIEFNIEYIIQGYNNS